MLLIFNTINTDALFLLIKISLTSLIFMLNDKYVTNDIYSVKN